MTSLVLYFLYAGLLFLIGLGCLYYAFRKTSAEEKMKKALQRVLPRNYGNPFLWMFGLFCIILALVMIFRKVNV